MGFALKPPCPCASESKNAGAAHEEEAAREKEEKGKGKSIRTHITRYRLGDVLEPAEIWQAICARKGSARVCFAVPSKLRRAIEDTQMSWPPNPRQNRLRAQPFGAHSAQRHVAWLRRKRAEDRCAAYRIVVVGHFLHEILGRLTAQAEQSVSHQTAHERRTRTVHGKNAAAGRWGRAGEARQEGRGTMRSPFHLLRSSLKVVPSGVSGRGQRITFLQSMGRPARK